MTNEALILPEGVDKLSNSQKVIALGLVGATAYFVLPFLIGLMVNILMFVLLAVPILFLALNYHLIWDLFKSISWQLTKLWIGLDILASMERCYEWFSAKLAETEKTASELNVTLDEIKEDVSKRELLLKENLKKADAAEKSNMGGQASLFYSYTVEDKRFITDNVPLRDMVQEKVDLLNEFTEVFSIKQKQLRYTIDAQTTTFNTLKKVNKGVNSANALISDNSSMAKIFKESNIQLTNKMNEFTANIQLFEKRIKPVLANAQLDKQLVEAEGRKLLEEFRKTNFELSTQTA